MYIRLHEVLTSKLLGKLMVSFCNCWACLECFPTKESFSFCNFTNWNSERNTQIASCIMFWREEITSELVTAVNLDTNSLKLCDMGEWHKSQFHMYLLSYLFTWFMFHATLQKSQHVQRLCGLRSKLEWTNTILCTEYTPRSKQQLCNQSLDLNPWPAWADTESAVRIISCSYACNTCTL